MLRPRHGASVLGLALLSACTCLGRRDETELADLVARVEGPRAARLVRLDEELPDWGGALAGAPSSGPVRRTSHRLVLDGAPPIVYALGCTPTAVQVSVAPESERFAVRCATSDPWTIVFVVPGPAGAPDATYRHVAWERALGPGNPGLRADGFVEWSRVPDLVASAPALLLVPGAEPGTTRVVNRATIFDEVLRRAGPAGLAAVVVATPAMDLLGDPALGEPWIDRYRTLPPDAQAAARRALIAALARPNCGAGAIVRAVALLDPREPGWLDALGARLLESERAAGADSSLLRILDGPLALLTRERPVAAGPIGCLALERDPRPSGPAWAALAAGGVACPVLEARVQALLADTEACGVLAEACMSEGTAPSPCEADALRARLTGTIEGRDTAFWPSSLSLLAAARGTNASTPPLEERVARASYTVDQPAAPRCRDAAPGASCACDALVNRHDRARAICASAGEGGSAQLCTFRFDAATRRIADVRRSVAP